MISPTGASRLFHAAGEPAVARAADKFGMPYSLSTVGTTTIEEIGAIGDVPKVFQIYVFKDRGITRSFVERCKASGYTALCLTVDTPVAGNRERDNYYGMMATARPALRSVPSMLRHPGWLYRAAVRKDMELVNIKSDANAQKFTDMSIKDFIDSQFDRSSGWQSSGTGRSSSRGCRPRTTVATRPRRARQPSCSRITAVASSRARPRPSTALPT